MKTFYNFCKAIAKNRELRKLELNLRKHNFFYYNY